MASVGSNERQSLARRAAAKVAHDYGIAFDDGSIIKDSNNTIVGINDQLVAKVATSTLAERDQAIKREAAVLRHLHDTEAPTSRLAPQVPPGPHDFEGVRIILLERFDELDEPPSSGPALAALRATHRALSDFTAIELPSFLEGMTVAANILSTPTRSPALPELERRFCRGVAAELAATIEHSSWPDVVLHGDPWIGGNLISTSQGPRLIDFEAICRGPIEWDLSSLAETADHAVEADHELLSTCRLLRSLTVVAWCWTQPDRAPEVAEAAHWHLALLHRTFGR